MPRSSLARLNARQPHTLFEALFPKLAAAVQTATPGHRLRFQAKLLSFDASLIELSLSLFPWAHFANRKAAVKLHVGLDHGLDHGGDLPVFAAVNPPHAAAAEFVRRQPLPPGSIAVFDKGCVSFALLAELAQRGVFFVTRMKAHSRGRVVAARREDLPPLRRVTTSMPRPGGATSFSPTTSGAPPAPSPSSPRSAGRSSCSASGSSRT